jgi:4-hydroxybenzoate polyprenyltransferase
VTQVTRLLDAFAFGNAVVAGAAVALVAAASRAMELRADPLCLLLAASGTLAVYGVDRLRDLARDRVTAPLRTAFVLRHRHAMAWLTALAALVALAAGALAGPRVVWVAAGVAALGLAHRRIKHRLAAKPIYLVLAWTAVAVALPWARAPGARHAAWVILVMALSVWANVILSNLKDEEGAAAYFGARRARRVALAACAAAACIALAAPPGVVRLAPLPVAVAAAVLGFRPSERYAAWAIDGALALGAALTLLA